jgi:hypothetical protein
MPPLRRGSQTRYALDEHRKLFRKLLTESKDFSIQLMTDPDYLEKIQAVAMRAQQGDASAMDELLVEVKQGVLEATSLTLEDIWRSFDADNSGYLDTAEVAQLLKEYLQWMGGRQ